MCRVKKASSGRWRSRLQFSSPEKLEHFDRYILADLASVHSFHELPTYRSLYVACIDDTSVASTDHDLHRDKIRRHLYGIIGPPV